MAKRILLSALVNVLGDFVDGLTEENLAVGVWSGKIVLNHVQLNRRAIEKLNLSVTVEHGFIETLEVTIPWTALESQPVKILINGVFLLLSAVDLSNLSPSEAHDRDVASRVSTLVQAEKSMELAMQMSLETENSDDSSYFQRLTSKIVDNLEVELRNVHLRYEDKITIPDSPFVCGVTLDTFTISTTDSTWRETFIARNNKHLIHKLAKVKNAGIYWNSMTAEESLSSLPMDEWVLAMQAFIFTSRHRATSPPPLPCSYIMKPPNTFTMKLLHNDTEGAVPKLSAVVDCSHLTLRLDRVQYHQAMRTKTRVEFLAKKQRLRQHRPLTPVRANPRAWWKYALVLLTNRGDILADKMATMMTCCRHRSQYISLLVASRLKDEETGECCELSPSQLAQQAGIEELVPLVALVIFRQLATQQAFRTNQERMEEAGEVEESADSGKDGWRVSSSSSSWWGWLGGSSDAEDDKGGSNSAVIASTTKTPGVDLADSLLYSSGHDSLSFTIDFKLLARASLSLTAEDIPVATLDTGLRLTGAVRASSLQIMFAMTDIILEDNNTVSPVVSKIVAVRRSDGGALRGGDSSKAPFSINFLSQAGKITVRVAAMPLEICLNKFCIQQLLSIFTVPDNDPPAIIDKLNRRFQTAFDLSISNLSKLSPEEMDIAGGDNKSPVPDSIDIIIDIESPKIIIPEDSSRDLGCLVLDTGHLLVSGSLTAAGMSWVVSLRAINADMPLSARDIYSTGPSKQYLIRPFGVDILVQTVNRSKADMTVEIEVTPNIRGELDVLKLSRLMHTIEVVTSTFCDDEGTTSELRNSAGVLSAAGSATATPLSSHAGMTFDPERVLMDITFSVQEVALTLQHSDHQDHCGALSVARLSAHIQHRAFDSTMQFDLGALAIEDSHRAATQRYLAQTPPSDDGVLVKISYVVITNVHSPLFIAHEKEVNVRFAKLNLHLDAISLQFLRPFYEVILGKRMTKYPQEIPTLSTLAAVEQQGRHLDMGGSASPSSPPQESSSGSARNLLSGEGGAPSPQQVQSPLSSDDCLKGTMHVVVTLEVISLEMFRSAECKTSESAVPAGFCSDRLELQSVASVDIQSLFADVTLTDIMEYDVSIQSVNVVDTREVSREYKFKTLFCPDSRDFYNNSSLEGDAKCHQDQIIIKYRENVEVHNLCKKNIDIIVNDLTGYISLDTILDVLAVTLENADAVLALVAVVPEDQLEHHSDNNAVHAAVAEPSVSMLVRVQAPNPRLFFLEDPTTRHSKAIVGRCAIDLRFQNEAIRGRTVELNQTLDLSVRDMELFVLFSMTKWNPRQILDPVTLDLHSKTCEESSIVTCCEYSLVIDSCNARLSLSDVILAQSILLRRTLLDASAAVPPPASNPVMIETHRSTAESLSNSNHNVARPRTTTINSSSQSNANTFLVAATAYTIAIKVDMAAVVLINDFKGKNLPIVQGVLQDLQFHADGVLQDLRGTGSFMLFADYFNGRNSEWEPILDRWQPTLQLSSSGTAALTLSLLSSETIQLSLTSTFLESILQTQALLFMLNEGSTIGRGSVPAVVFRNQLGVPVQLLLPNSAQSFPASRKDSSTLFRLEGDDEASVFTLSKGREHQFAPSQEEVLERKGPLSVVLSSLPSSLWLRFTEGTRAAFVPRNVVECGVSSKIGGGSGMNGGEDRSTLEVPLMLNRPKKYQVVSNQLLQSLPSSSVPLRVRSKANITKSGKDVVEEVFENQRYTPLSGSWLDPFLVSDPEAWTSRDWRPKRKEDVKLPGEEWEWQHDWKIDRWTHRIGVDIDDDCFEYAMRFQSFVDGQPHLCSILDCVRRRRWVRTRSLIMSQDTVPQQHEVVEVGSGCTSALNFLWDSHMLEDGSKEIILRSQTQIQNLLPFDICLRLHNSCWEDKYVEFGPVKKDSIMAIPLLVSDAASLQVKPFVAAKDDSDVFHWSQPIPCAPQTLDYVNYQDLLCVQRPAGTTINTSTKHIKSSTFINNLPMRSKITQVDSSVLVTLTGYVEITNVLPCTAQYRCFNSFDLHNIEQTLICAEEGRLLPGESCKLTYVSLLYETFVTFQVGTLGWSPKILLSKLANNRAQAQENHSRRPDTVHEYVEFPKEDGSTALLLRMEIQMDSFKGLTSLRLYSKNALVDRTGLGVCIRSDVQFASKTTGAMRRETMKRYSVNNHKDNSSSSSQSSEFITPSSKKKDETSFVVLDQLVVKSDNRYKINLGHVGCDVHSDRSHTYTYLPPALCGQTYIATPCEDRAIHLDSANFLQFQVEHSAVVLVLFNKLVAKPPRWVRKGGFRRLVEQAISQSVFNGVTTEVHYNIYGKLFSSHSLVELGSNYTKDAREMYTVFVAKLDKREGCAEMLEQINYNRFKSQRTEAVEAWSSGGNGLTLFDCDNERIGVGTSNGVAWSGDIKLNTLGTSTKGNFEIFDKIAKKIYQLAYNVQMLPGLFDLTSVVTIMPQYCLVNCLDIPLEVRQQGSALSQFVDPFSSAGWHKESSRRNSTIHLRCASTLWSFGAFDVNEVGTASLLLPAVQSKSSNSPKEPTILNVEVKIADATDMCMVTITIWKSKTPQSSLLSINNESTIPITLCQSRVNFDTQDVALRYELTVPGQSWVSYGWADPDASKKVLLSAGEAPLRQHTRAITLDMLRMNSKIRLPVGEVALQQQSKRADRKIVKEVVLTVESNGSGVVLRIFEQKHSDVNEASSRDREEHEKAGLEASAYAFVFNFSSFGVSVIADEPNRREILSLYAEDMTGEMRCLGNTSSFEFGVRDMQIDNYCETLVHPVLFRRVRTAQPLKVGEEEPPFLQLVVILETRHGPPSTVTCKYISIRILEFAVELDSGTIQIVFQDFLQNLNFVSKDQALALQAPQEWMDEYNEVLLSPESRLQLVNTYAAHLTVQQPKIVFENFIFHPLKISLTFLHTRLPRNRLQMSQRSVSSAVLNMLSSIVEVELMTIKLNSFMVANAVESVGSLLSRIEGKVLQDLKGQLAQMAGSLIMLGSPVGLARNIGTGVEAFFYEPYQGLVLGPHDFVRGLGRGTSSLVAGFVSGTLTSTAALVSTASCGISYLSGDSDFVRDRTLKMQKLHASRGGAIEGLRGGGDLVVEGFASGISGIFSKPMEGAQNEGAHGFVKGLGLGVVGALVKPTLGLADGFSSAAAGISNEVGFTARAMRARPARTFERSPNDPTVRVLTALDMAAIKAQEVVRTLADAEQTRGKDLSAPSDEFIACFNLDNDVHVILSELKVMTFHRDKMTRVHNWSEVSHCYFSSDHVGVLLYSSKHSSNPVKIYFRARHRGVALYKCLLLHSYLMGNPPGTLPLDRADELASQRTPSAAVESSLTGTGSGSNTSNEAPVSSKVKEDTLSSCRYIFGSAEVTVSEVEVCSEKQLLLAARARLAAAPREDVCGDGDAPAHENNGAETRRDALYAKIDKTVAWLVHSYLASCNKFSRSRCCAVVVVNASGREVTVLDLVLVKGRHLHAIDVASYDKDSRSITPNDGVALFLGTGLPPSFYESGVVELSLSTSAFDAVLSTDPKRTSISERKRGDGRRAGFIEKTSKEWWSRMSAHDSKKW